MATQANSQQIGYELRYANLFSEGRALAFPCDNCGHVDMDSLSDRARDNYLVARALVGRDYASPVVRPIHTTAH